MLGITKSQSSMTCVESRNTANNHVSDSNDTNICEEKRIKPEIELKEEIDSYIYKADVRGHLQLVSLDPKLKAHSSKPFSGNDSVYHNSTSQHFVEGDTLFRKPENLCDVNKIEEPAEEKNLTPQCTDLNEDPQQHWLGMTYILPTSGDSSEVIMTWEERSENSKGSCTYKQFQNESFQENFHIKEEPDNIFIKQCNNVQSLPEIYKYSSNGNSWEKTNSIDEQNKDLHDMQMKIQQGHMILLTQAEKKRLYRLRIKEENPTLWSSIKRREATRKREQREKRREILHEMQKAMEYESLPYSPDSYNNKIYFATLKERYPDLWAQLESAIPATQLRNDIKYHERNPKSRRHEPKPAKMYKDVVEAQKKRLYRQKIKQERPDLYARQKARDAYARSIQRHLMKNQLNAGIQQEIKNNESFTGNKEIQLTYLHNLQTENIKSTHSDQFQEEQFHVSDCNNNTSMRDRNPNCSTLSTASTTQSDILWYWNDIRNGHSLSHLSPEQTIQSFSNEERLQKIVREHIQLKEKRRHYRMNMTPEKRAEFLETERERLKIYRLKKKAESELQRNEKRENLL